MKKTSILLLLILILAAVGFFLLLPYIKSKPAAKIADAESIFHRRNLGLAHLEEMRLTDAEQEFRELIKSAPDQALPYGNLALVYLRLGKYKEAEEQAKAAVQKDPSNSDAALILAEVYEQSGKFADAIQLMEKSVQSNPDHFRSRYKLIQLLLRNTNDPASVLPHFEKLSEQLPGNIAVQLQYIEVLVRAGRKDEAIKKLQLLRQQLPELEGPPKELLQQTIDALLHNSEEAVTSSVMLHNVLKPTEVYRAGITELKGPGAPIIGFPLLFFDPAFQKKLLSTEDAAAIPMQFEEILMQGVPSGTLAAADYDSDGDPDLFAAGELFKNEKGKFTEQFNFEKNDATFAIFLDYDNDGHLDLYQSGNNFQAIFKNDGKGKWSNVTKQLGIPDNIGASKVLVFDFDQDGDLDLFKIGNGKNAAYRNNGDETFEERSESMGLAGESQDGSFLDFDEDGDLDLVLSNEQSIKVYSNLREARFQDVTSSALQQPHPATTFTSADLNNNGFLDLLSVSDNKSYYYNNSDGKFDSIDASSLGISVPADVRRIRAADFDNDGHVDVLVITKTLVLFRNIGDGKFKQTSVFPKNVSEIKNEVIADIDSDGDLDLLISDSQSQTKLLRNSGGNANRWLNVTLKGLGTGSGKNNRFGIGASVELLAGELYQKHVATDPIVHFGLGEHATSDVVRVVWTNGVPQNRIRAAANQTIVEEQILKGSCAFLYAWNGTKFDFVTDILWRSALGMPLGIMGGSTTYAFADASQEHIKISGKQLKPRDGKLSLRITEELWETPYLDQITLTAVDHPADSEIFVDEKFVPPPFPLLHIYMVSKQSIPHSAVNERGEDLLPYISKKDDSYTPNLIPAKFQGITTMHDLILEPGPVADSNRLLLFLNGWIFPSDASINTGLSQGQSERATPPTLEVLDSSGNWKTKTVIGFPGGKDKTVVVDLRGKLDSGVSKIRIRSSMEVYWDQVFFAEESQTETKLTKLNPSSSDLSYRGFSKLYRKGLYGPHWFDYNAVSKEPLWRDLAGNYTRFGDVNPLLLKADSKYVIFNAGDEIAVEFDTKNLPELPQGWTRDYLIFTIGWLKDGDLNTATSSTVEPLPFHGMTKYPYGNEQSYPQDPDHQEYLRMYNTRKVEHKLKLLSK